MNRELIMTAAFNLVAASAGFQTSGRRLVLWNKCPSQPAIFLRNVGDEYPQRPARGLPAKVTIKAEIWIYTKVGPDDVPGSSINGLVDAVEAALQPATGAETQTLGGLVSHCWIEGEIMMDPGDIDGQAKAIIPIKILASV